ncbi:thioredoxin [Halobacteriaceae archaeon GCM10025711]
MASRNDANSVSSSSSTDTPVHVEEHTDLDDIVASNQVVLADFHAEWCGPCKMLEPIVEELAAETPVTVAKVDVDEFPTLAGSYQVQGVPTMVLFADGEMVERIVGLRDKSTLETLINQHAN